MKKLFVFLFLFLQSFAFSQNSDQETQLHFSTPYIGAPDFLTTLVSINEENDETMILLLSDGSQWRINTNFLQILEQWKEGDEIRWKKDAHLNKYLLKNIQSSNFLPAELDFSITPSSCYTIEAIDKNGYLILLQEGRQWVIGYWGSFTSCKWRKGDPLIINKSDYSRSEDYCLVNINTQDTAWGSLIYWK